MLKGAGGGNRGMSKRRSPQDKADVVVEFFTTRISAAELCRKHNVSPTTFQDWKEKFLQGGRQAPAGHGDVDKNHVREIEHPRRIIAEITISNDVLKKLWRGQKDGDGGGHQGSEIHESQQGAGV